MQDKARLSWGRREERKMRCGRAEDCDREEKRQGQNRTKQGSGIPSTKYWAALLGQYLGT